MSIRSVLAAVLILATAACSGDPTTPSPAPAVAGAHPAWLVGGWGYGKTDGAEVHHEEYSFSADGTGTWLTSTVYLASGLTDYDQPPLEWSFDAPDGLFINGTRHTIEVVPGCINMKMDTITWHGSPAAGTCPTPADALSATEQTFAGAWTLVPADDGDYETFRGTLQLGTERDFTLSLVVENKGSWEILDVDKSGDPWRADDSGEVEVETSDGGLHMHLTRKGSSLEICYGGFTCFVGHR